MKFNRLILLVAVPLIAAMAGRPENDEPGSRYVRGVVGAGQEAPADPATAPDAPAALEIISATEADPAQFLWTQRPVVIFADTPQDPAFVEQLARVQRDPAPLLIRDVVIITDTDPAARSEWRRSLRPEGFSLVVLDKDGQVKQRKPAPWSVRELSRAIDKFPLRRQEIGRAGVVQ